jgi:hypothetical protein
MAPNLSGIASSDAAKMVHLIELALEFSQNHMKPQGALVATLHDFTEQTTVSKYTEESALPELEGPIDPRDYVTVSFSQRDWAALTPAGWNWSTRPERYGGTQQILVLRRAEA